MASQFYSGSRRFAERERCTARKICDASLSSLASKARLFSAEPCSGSCRTKQDSSEQALTACGETCRQATALGLKPRAVRLRSSTLRLTVGGISLVWSRDRAGTTVSARTRVFESPSRRPVERSETGLVGVMLRRCVELGTWSNGKTPASRAGDGCSSRSVPIPR